MTNQRVRRKADSKKSKYMQECSVTPCWQPDKAICKPTWLPNKEKGFACKEENPTRSLHNSSQCVLRGTWLPVHASTTCSKGMRMRHSALACHAKSFLSQETIYTVSAWWCFSFSCCHSYCQDLGSPGLPASSGWAAPWLSLWCCFSLFSLLGTWKIHCPYFMTGAWDSQEETAPTSCLVSALTHSLHPMPQSCSNHIPTVFFSAPLLICFPIPNPFTLFLFDEGL